jgi:hypothetical protein
MRMAVRLFVVERVIVCCEGVCRLVWTTPPAAAARIEVRISDDTLSRLWRGGGAAAAAAGCSWHAHGRPPHLLGPLYREA